MVTESLSLSPFFFSRLQGHGLGGKRSGKVISERVLFSFFSLPPFPGRGPRERHPMSFASLFFSLFSLNDMDAAWKNAQETFLTIPPLFFFFFFFFSSSVA